MEGAIAAIHERFRQANVELERRYRDLRADGLLPFICECGDERCTRVITLTLGEYDDLRARPSVYAVVPGHEAADEHVVAAGDRYSLARLGDVTSRSGS